MKYHVTHTVSCWIEAETEEGAQRELAELIRDNMEWTDCKITGEDEREEGEG